MYCSKTNAQIQDIIRDYNSLTVASMGTIPGLRHSISWKQSTNSYYSSETFIPQGICVAGNYILVSAYDGTSDTIKANSVIYVIKSSDRSYVTTLILPFVAHVGGITYDISNQYIWVAKDSSIVGIPYSALQEVITEHNADNNRLYGAYRITSMQRTYIAKNTVSCLTYYDGLVWAGTFNKSGTSDIYGYAINLTSPSMITRYRIEAPQKTQGLTFYKNNNIVYLAVSTSYGTSNSTMRLYRPSYNNPQIVAGETYKQILKNSAYRTISFPCYAEELHINGSQIFIIFESGAFKYRNNTSDIIEKYLMIDKNSFFNI